MTHSSSGGSTGNEPTIKDEDLHAGARAFSRTSSTDDAGTDDDKIHRFAHGKNLQLKLANAGTENLKLGFTQPGLNCAVLEWARLVFRYL
jgi:hypothetical protein